MKLKIKKTLKIMTRVTLAITLASLLLVCLSVYFSNKPSIQSHAANSTAFYSSEGKLLRLTLSEDQQYRLWVSLKNIPLDLQEATLLYEDQYFHSHHGVNLFALLRATYSTYLKKGRRLGASTITMQLARMQFELNTTSIRGKLIQIKQALVLERHFTKQQILEAYLNKAPYGHNIQGVGAASLIYFHKKPENLITAESLLLAVVPQNPNRRLPSTKSGYQQASAARSRLVKLWVTQKSVALADRENLSLPLQTYSPKALPFHAPHLVDQLIKTRNKRATSSRRNAASTALRATQNPAENALTTTVALELQLSIERLTKRYIEKHRAKGLANASVMVVDYTNMGIKAELGSVDYFDASIFGQVNGTRALRSPGSTLKPFIYALGLEQGLIHPSSLLMDTPKRFSAYSPENYDKQFSGPLSARDALVRSRNIPAVKLMQELKSPSFHSWLAQTNPRRLEPEAHYGLALALGGNEVSMLELVQWYAAIANHGQYRQANSVTSRMASIASIHNTGNSKRILSPEASYLSLQMLSSNPAPGRRFNQTGLSTVRQNQMEIPWKTGTSFAFRDAWSIGVVGQYVVGVWVGNFDGSANPALIGRKAAAPLFFQVAEHLQKDSSYMQAPWQNTDNLNLKKINVCKISGDLETEHCPSVEQDWFIPGVSPIKSKRVFRNIPINIQTGLRACGPNNENTKLEIFEFWPSDIALVFKNAGIYKKKPPPYMPSCEQFVMQNANDAPEITSPSPNLTYALQSDRLSREKIPLQATVASDADTLYWFVDNQFIGESKPEHAMLWNPKQGSHQVTVIDNMGRSSQTSVRATLVN